MKAGRLLKKTSHVPLQISTKRAASLLKRKESPLEVHALEDKSSITPNNVANRLVQKRISIDRKIENMRKIKLEAEMKEVQSKPKISVRSRKLAVKAEKKILDVEKTPTAPIEEKKLFIKKKNNNHKDLAVKTDMEQKLLNNDKHHDSFGDELNKIADNDFLRLSQLPIPGKFIMVQFL